MYTHIKTKYIVCEYFRLKGPLFSEFQKKMKNLFFLNHFLVSFFFFDNAKKIYFIKYLTDKFFYRKGIGTYITIGSSNFIRKMVSGKIIKKYT